MDLFIRGDWTLRCISDCTCAQGTRTAGNQLPTPGNNFLDVDTTVLVTQRWLYGSFSMRLYIVLYTTFHHGFAHSGGRVDSPPPAHATSQVSDSQQDMSSQHANHSRFLGLVLAANKS